MKTKRENMISKMFSLLIIIVSVFLVVKMNNKRGISEA
jgi:hypothetical protein